MEATAGDPFWSFSEPLVDAAPLLFILASAAAHFYSECMEACPELYLQRGHACFMLRPMVSSE